MTRDRHQEHPIGRLGLEADPKAVKGEITNTAVLEIAAPGGRNQF